MNEHQSSGPDALHHPLSRSLIMGVVNATPDSFSDAGRYPDVASRLARIDELVAHGADIIDIGGQSAVTGKPEVDPTDELNAVRPLVDHVVAHHPGVVVSIDTYKPAVVEGVLEAGAHIINDVTGLRYPEVADLVAAAGAWLVVMHNRGKPKERLTDTGLYDDVVADVVAFIGERIDEATGRGVTRDRIIVDPGPDFSKTPFQTIELLRNASAFDAFGLPVLMPISRKDFIGAVLHRGPTERLAGTLGAIAYLETQGSYIYRVHDVAECADMLQMLSVLGGATSVSVDLELPVELRRVRT